MTLRENLDALEDDELLSKVVTESLTDEADAIARELLASRGVQIPALEAGSAASTASPPLIKRWVSLIKKSLQGEAPLGVAWSVCGMTTLMFVITTVLGMMIYQSTILRPIFEAGFLLAIVMGFPMQAYCVWRCSENTSSRLWSAIAILYSMLIGLVVVVVLLAAIFN
jgi:hypothetical protein